LAHDHVDNVARRGAQRESDSEFCGYSLERTLKEVEVIAAQPAWRDAVGAAEVYVAAGGGYFTRPGPRLVTGIELLAASFHPDRVDWQLPADGLCRWRERLLQTS
jgi:hypothetical protein